MFTAFTKITFQENVKFSLCYLDQDDKEFGLVYFLQKKNWASGSAEWLPVLVECFHFTKCGYSKQGAVQRVLVQVYHHL